MNAIENKLKQGIQNAVKKAWDVDVELDQIVIEIPKDKSHGDYATNLAMRLTKQLRSNPKMIAENLIANLDLEEAGIETVTIAGPGFINFKMQTGSLTTVIHTVLTQNENFGQTNAGNGLKVNVEYVSVNPTGDVHVAHGRGAVMKKMMSKMKVSFQKNMD